MSLCNLKFQENPQKWKKKYKSLNDETPASI